MVNMCDNAKISDVLHVLFYLIFRGGEGNEKRRERRDYVAGICATIWLLLRRTLVRYYPYSTKANVYSNLAPLLFGILQRIPTNKPNAIFD
jgi:hypothetical protein